MRRWPDRVRHRHAPGWGRADRCRRYQLARGTPDAAHAARVPIRGASAEIASLVTARPGSLSALSEIVYRHPRVSVCCGFSADDAGMTGVWLPGVVAGGVGSRCPRLLRRGWWLRCRSSRVPGRSRVRVLADQCPERRGAGGGTGMPYWVSRCESVAGCSGRPECWPGNSKRPAGEMTAAGCSAAAWRISAAKGSGTQMGGSPRRRNVAPVPSAVMSSAVSRVIRDAGWANSRISRPAARVRTGPVLSVSARRISARRYCRLMG